MATEAQRRANKKYKEKHKQQQNIYIKRSTARNFIKNYANLNDLQELQELIKVRQEQLNDNAQS